MNIIKEKRAGLQSLLFTADKLPEIEAIELELMDALSGSKDTVREMCGHVLSAGGKRIRPLLVMYSGMIFSGMRRELLQAAVASELIHMASLVHDDIIDKSGLRRNRPSVNRLWGNHYAVLCGDYLFARAFGVLAGNRLMESMDYMVEAIENMCQGEVNQAADRFNCNTDMEAYYKRIAQKTAIFIACCCKSGASVGGAGKEEIEIIGEYGLNLGYAFQIIDDILDYCGNTEATGKPVCEDLKDGVVTLPVIYLLEDERFAGYVREALRSKSIGDGFIGEVREILSTSGAIDKSYEMAASHIKKAKACLDLLPQNPYTLNLHSMADLLQKRMN